MLRQVIKRQFIKSKEAIDRSIFAQYYKLRLKLDQPGEKDPDPKVIERRSLYYYRKLVQLTAELPPIDRRRILDEFRFLLEEASFDITAVHAVCQHILDSKETAFALINRRRDVDAMFYRDEDPITRDKYTILGNINLHQLYKEKRSQIEMTDAERDRQSSKK